MRIVRIYRIQVEDCPTSIFHKEVEIRGAFQLEHLQGKMKVFIKLQFYLSSRTDQPSALVLPLTLCLSLLGFATQTQCQGAGGQSGRAATCERGILCPLFSFPVEEAPPNGRRLVAIHSHICCQAGMPWPSLPPQPGLKLQLHASRDQLPLGF